MAVEKESRRNLFNKTEMFSEDYWNFLKLDKMSYFYESRELVIYNLDLEVNYT